MCEVEWGGGGGGLVDEGAHDRCGGEWGMSTDGVSTDISELGR